ncbi:MAG TPA: 8-amino-7-oxononanoate synthase [Persephonella sp.]|uniref:8-amino-7-oxononanoate synthase (Aons) (8-amino-7-ketopelargonate synthase) (7-keto-8-amino-pelargonic acid synthetase)(7-kap synthetase) (L-alanine--pimelyl-coa ligase) n=1 Tax=Persephonella marina (strain DSM 14350 / EX-H1) TaxID=123214 RepID=C0QQQ7_PERMH|nr:MULTISPECIES: aminotransferase class I/II-fold pyridoxal phosphate-dependent enzyme [Persephonella]ACO03731.1 8-amino-7-oxononanoate synthase (aons) (8-amino-7-ketopelargonate synthase) (7-keto-8-amino-pelargonic acid synthetase)(7-kap synthetase) (l-alanine--pimelyl-coa ligase) [Persephonella marina EX-H1]HCB68754.1 8-amino-7-oxononanoate synthase [Persephonella sp.]
MDFNGYLESRLEDIKRKGLYRKRFIVPENLIDFSSNDYLGLKDCEETKKVLCENIEKLSLGSGASQLVSGYKSIQKELEDFLSEFKESEDCIVLGSGYLANTGLIQALTEEGDIVFSDQFNHASIIDGIRLSRAEKVIYRHNDMNDLEDKLKKSSGRGKRFIVTDGVFSMEGDTVNFPDLKFLADRYGAVVILDDAHSTGILGNGKGTIFHYGMKPDENIIQMGTLSKAVGSYGAFVCGSRTVIDFLINRMRTVIFSTALSPIQNFISLNNLKIMVSQPFRREYILKQSEYLAENLKKLGYNIEYRGTPILSLMIGKEDKAVRLRDLLVEKGIFIQAIRPPTVPEGSSRLRITISYRHSKEDIDYLIDTLKELRDKL